MCTKFRSNFATKCIFFCIKGFYFFCSSVIKIQLTNTKCKSDIQYILSINISCNPEEMERKKQKSSVRNKFIINNFKKPKKQVFQRTCLEIASLKIYSGAITRMFLKKSYSTLKIHDQ